MARVLLDRMLSEKDIDHMKILLLFSEVIKLAQSDHEELLPELYLQADCYAKSFANYLTSEGLSYLAVSIWNYAIDYKQ